MDKDTKLEFEDWLSSHRHSSATIETELQTCQDLNEEDGDTSPTSLLEAFIERMEELKSEVIGEIDEAKQWLKRLEGDKNNALPDNN